MKNNKNQTQFIVGNNNKIVVGKTGIIKFAD